MRLAPVKARRAKITQPRVSLGFGLIARDLPFRLSMVGLGRNREHRRDAYEILWLGDARGAEAEQKVS
jgi:hypothetical protein